MKTRYNFVFFLVVLLAVSLALLTVEAVSSLNESNVYFGKHPPISESDASFRNFGECKFSQTGKNSSTAKVDSSHNATFLQNSFSLFKKLTLFFHVYAKSFLNARQRRRRDLITLEELDAFLGTWTLDSDNSGETTVNYSFGFSFYLGWVTLFVELFVLTVQLPKHG